MFKASGPINSFLNTEIKWTKFAKVKVPNLLYNFFLTIYTLPHVIYISFFSFKKLYLKTET